MVDFPSFNFRLLLNNHLGYMTTVLFVVRGINRDEVRHTFFCPIRPFFVPRDMIGRMHVCYHLLTLLHAKTKGLAHVDLEKKSFPIISV